MGPDRRRDICIGILPALALVSCNSEEAGQVTEGAVQQPSSSYGPLAEVPTEFLGQWYLTRQECEPALLPEEAPLLDDLPQVSLLINADFTYGMAVDGVMYEDTWQPSGKFAVNHFIDGVSLTFEDNMFDFEPVDGTLQHWGGDATAYVCGFVYTRDKY